MALMIVFGDINSLILSVETFWSKSLNTKSAVNFSFKLFVVSLPQRSCLSLAFLASSLARSRRWLWTKAKSYGKTTQTTQTTQTTRTTRTTVGGRCASCANSANCARSLLAYWLAQMRQTHLDGNLFWISVQNFSSSVQMIQLILKLLGRNWGRAKQQSREGWAKSRSPPDTSVGRADGVVAGF